MAALAGVSKSLVSLVLRDAPSVSPAKREAVREAMQQLGYRPNLTARQLTERRTRTIGVLLNDLRNPWFVDGLATATAVLRAEGYRLLLADGQLDADATEDVLSGFADLRVDGVLLLGTLADTPATLETARSLPTVAVGNRDLGSPVLDVVAGDDVHGTRLAVDHLVQLGHRRIGHVAGSLGKVAALRHQAFLERTAESGIEGSVATGEMTEQGGRAAGLELLRSSTPTAVVAVNDIAAVGVLSAARELGLHVPQDLSLVGYDNSALARLEHLSLTSVENDLPAIGELAARALLDRIDDPARPAATHLTVPHLVVRGTSAPPPRG
ncbi:LacI family DNA-binding transcriptional regulator [Nakamurella alba]|uniref:LacI family DNA-binding transcriptional regulator n=1 Tax=Nakamurella alba TaxID=2665158 RepID=UPI002AC31346|nr:LacI family DNA-binding transcriptional regulator [Nakamurella alba]